MKFALIMNLLAANYKMLVYIKNGAYSCY